ncbi:protein spaetzle isoform X1 [Stomoxys calcitrans]|nr:protein spaetzle isoform X1 [Stomoxys calcitrans]
MAQFSTHLPVLLLLFAVFNPIVCPSSRINSDRRDRAPSIDTSDLGQQYLGDTLGRAASRTRLSQFHIPSSLASTSIHLQNIHQTEEIDRKNGRVVHTQISVPPTVPYTSSHSQKNPQDDDINKKIDRIFDTDFGPGLHLFNNTEPKAPTLHSYDNDYTHFDQPTSVSSTTEANFFKVQRSPTGKLDVVYRKDFVPLKSDNSSHDNGDGQRTGESSKGPTKENESLGNPNNKQSPTFFPTEEPGKDDANFTVNSDDCVEKDGEHGEKSFCTNLRNYPERTYLEKVIKKKFSNLEIFFGEDLVIPQNISQRMNSEPHEEYLCKTRTRVIYPQAGLNKDYNWLIIVNIPNYKQGIRIEECINEGSTCGESNGLQVPNRYTATCKQSYIYRSLVAFTNETVIRDQFKMPSCCKCVLRSG